jgi:hypothetical protein
MPSKLKSGSMASSNGSAGLVNNKCAGTMSKGGTATNDDARKTNPVANDNGTVQMMSDENNNCASKKRRRNSRYNIHTGRIRIDGTAHNNDTGQINSWRLGS